PAWPSTSHGSSWTFLSCVPTVVRRAPGCQVVGSGGLPRAIGRLPPICLPDTDSGSPQDHSATGSKSGRMLTPGGPTTSRAFCQFAILSRCQGPRPCFYLELSSRCHLAHLSWRCSSLPGSALSPPAKHIGRP